MSVLTRAGFESVLIARVGRKMAAAGLDGTTKDGTNADLNDPIRRAVQSMGVATADPVTVADGDLASFSGFPAEKLFDLAHVAVLHNILGNWAYVDQQTGQDYQNLNQFADQVRQEIASLEARLEKPYGPMLGGSQVAPMTTGQTMPNDPLAWPRGRSPLGRWPYSQ